MSALERHLETSDRFLDQAEAELREGDLLQASEKAWGAVAHYVKGIAAERGWPSNSHRAINRHARALIAQTDAPEINNVRLIAANGLHQNFYENWFEAGQVEEGIRAVGALLDALREVNHARP